MSPLEPGTELAPQEYVVTRADLVAYAGASGDHNPIHQDEAIAHLVGLPGVIAHGMYTMALAARAVATWSDDAEVVELGCKFTAPVVVPAEGGATVRVAGTVKGVQDGRATIALEVTCAGEKVLGAPKAVVLSPEAGERGTSGSGRSDDSGTAPERLADHTTLRLGGPARAWVRAETEEELVAAVTDADAAGEPVLVLGGGSNLVVADAGFAGTVVEVATRGVSADIGDDDDPTCGGAMVTVAAGETWDDLVARAVERGWVGIEALSGIPGSVGATPIQNVGAYGQEVAQTIASVRVWDRKLRGIRTFAAADCGFGYRTSRFKIDRFDANGGRHLVLSVTFQLRQGSLGSAVAYAELGRALGVEVGQRAPLADVRAAVLGLRSGKGMVLDAADHDTWSAGSFFTNPVVPAEEVPDGAPAWPTDDPALVKTSAAWLIEHAGFGKGHGLDRDGAHVALSTKHTLALTNRGGATADELLALAREVRDGVRSSYGITLVNEPVLVGCSL